MSASSAGRLALRASILLATSPGAALADPCSPPIDLASAGDCAVQRSTEVAAARLDVEVAQGRSEALGGIFPERPEIGATLSRRSLGETSTTNGSLELAQRIDLAGARAAAAEASGHRLQAARYRMWWAEQNARAAGMSRFLELVAAGERVKLAREATQLGSALAEAMRVRRGEEIASELDLSLARAEAAELERQLADEVEGHAEALSRWALLVGSSADVEGSLVLPGWLPDARVAASPAEAAGGVRPDVAASIAEVKGATAEVAQRRRERVPVPRLWAFLQRDGFGENVAGGGISFPLPLPGAVAPTGGGELHAARAEQEQAAARLEQTRRSARADLEVALGRLQARQRALDAIPDDLLATARAQLHSLGTAVREGQLGVGDASRAARSLLDLQRSAVAGRLAVGLARIELARAGNLPLTRSGR